MEPTGGSRKIILGISAFYHDSAASLSIDGRVACAAQEERFTRLKHTAEFPIHSIRYCLEEAGLDVDELDAVVFYEKPLLKFERLLETYYAFAPMGLFSFLKAIPVWLDEKLFLKKRIYDGLKQLGPYSRRDLTLLFSEHHLSHAASAFYPSPFDESAILTIDGVGEWASATIGHGKGRKITIGKEMHFPHSVGLLYSAFTYFLGFEVNGGEYKLMGLAPYGDPSAEETKSFVDLIRTRLVDIKEDGSIWMDQQYFHYAKGLRMVKDRQWERLFGFPRRNRDEKLDQRHCNLAFAIQHVTEEIVLRMARESRRMTGSKNLCMAGGVALNCVANGKIVKEGIFDRVFIQPAAGDAGGSLGACLAAHHLYFGEERMRSGPGDGMSGSLLGPSYSDKEIRRLNKRMKATSKHFEEFDALVSEVAGLIADGKIVGWFQGRMEFGPRALGNRSILADPRDPDMQRRINREIKFRESFRPFAPAVLREDSSRYFDLVGENPYMLLTAGIRDEVRHPVPVDYHRYSMQEKLDTPGSPIPSVTHVDHSARVQTVTGEENPRFRKLIRAFRKLTGTGILINTSFNVKGEPIVLSPLDAYRCFMSTGMDILVIGDHLYEKEKQPGFQNNKGNDQTLGR